MPESVITQLWDIVPTLVYFVLGLVLFLFSIWLIGRITPFSVRKEIEEDQNTSLAILMGAALIGIAIILAAVIR